MGLPLKFALGTRVAIGTIRYSPLRWIVRSVVSKWELNVEKPESRELYGQFAPSRVSLHAVYQIMELQKVLCPELHKISNPLLLLYGKKDITAPPFNANLARKLVASDVVETKFFERSRHILTIDWDEEEVKRTIVDFFLRFG
jgi:esterase/lipase